MSKTYEYDGEGYTLEELAAMAGVSAQTMRIRLKTKGLTTEQAVKYNELRLRRLKKDEKHTCTNTIKRSWKEDWQTVNKKVPCGRTAKWAHNGHYYCMQCKNALRKVSVSEILELDVNSIITQIITNFRDARSMAHFRRFLEQYLVRDDLAEIKRKTLEINPSLALEHTINLVWRME